MISSLLLAACVVSSPSGKVKKEPRTLEALLDCQGKALQDASDRYLSAHGSAAPSELVDRWSDVQRAETRGYIARHPGATIAGAPEEKPAKGESDEAFKKRMWKASDDGRAGVTPEMARDMAERIRAQQGSVSPDMQELLDAVSKDGAKLTPETMNKLRAAAKSADGQGLDLGVTPEIKDALLKAPDPDEEKDWRRGSGADADAPPSL